MRVSPLESGMAGGAAPAAAVAIDDPVRALFAALPRPIRFLGVGGLGLTVDLAVFTFVISHEPHPLIARLLSLAVATLVTWRLNRALTFERTGRHPAHEALRYAAVAGTAQAASYSLFAVLVVALPNAAPQLALVAGAAAGALVSYCGQAFFAFRPHCSPTP